MSLGTFGIVGAASSGMVGAEAGSFISGESEPDPYLTALLVESPLAVWMLGESSGTDMLDSSGNGRAGSYTGTPTLGELSIIPNSTGTCADLDGTEYGSVSYAAWMGISDVTVEAVVEVGSVSGVRGIIGRYGSSNSHRPFWISSTNAQVYWISRNAGGSVTVLSSASDALSSEGVYHIAATRESGSQKLYINGVEVDSDTDTGSLQTTTSPALEVGRTLNSGWVGKIQAAAIYDSALSHSQILSHAVATGLDTFDPESDLSWHSLFWAEGTDFQVQGYTDTDTVSNWPNETGESDASVSANPPSLDAVNSSYNDKPVVDFSVDNNRLLDTSNFSVAPTYPLSVVVIGNMGAASGINDAFFDGNDSTNRNSILKSADASEWRIFARTGTVVGGTADNDPHLFVGVFDGSTGNETLNIDGATVISGSDAGSSQLDGLRIGNLSAGTFSCRGNIALIGLYEGDITSDSLWPTFKAWVELHYGLTIA